MHIIAHTGKESHISLICVTSNKSYIEHFDLKRHMKVHTGEDRFKCNECDISDLRNDDLKMHIEIHTGEKSFHCIN